MARQLGYKTDNRMNALFSADYVVPVTRPPLKNGVVELTDDGVIVAVHAADSRSVAERDVIRYPGMIVPGFINTHCHLELSHMVGAVPEHTGLAAFLLRVMGTRAAESAAVQQAMEAADAQMAANGIVAVGDHANNSSSAEVKRRSPIHYHTFLETIGFEPEQAAEKLNASRLTAGAFEADRVSLTAHAPYSVSEALFVLLDRAREAHIPLSIHNQESAAENTFFRRKQGEFLEFYRTLGRDISGFTSTGTSSLQAYVPFLSPASPLLLVHNTFTVADDIRFAAGGGRDITWCLCPKANLYIEDALPDVQLFMKHNQRMALGTDSLASNDRLCVLSELQVLHARFPQLPFTETIKWATINGAAALNISNRYGSLEEGKRPGLNLLTHTEGLAITPHTTVRPLVQPVVNK